MSADLISNELSINSDSHSESNNDEYNRNEFFESDEYNKNLSRPSLEPAKLRQLQSTNINIPNNNIYNKSSPSVPPYAIPTNTLKSSTSIPTNPSSITKQIYQTSINNKSIHRQSNVPIYASINTTPQPVPPTKPLLNNEKYKTVPTPRSNISTYNTYKTINTTSTSRPVSPSTKLNSLPAAINNNLNTQTPTSQSHQLHVNTNTTQHTTPVASYHTTFKNLDTGESYQSFDDMKQRYPEVLTIDQYEQNSYSESSSRSTSRNQSVSTPSESDKEHSDTTSEKRNNLGYRLERMFKQALHIDSSDNDTSSHTNNSRNTTTNKQSTQIKSKVKRKSYQELTQLNLIQTINEHHGPIWTFSISCDGQFIATGGQDGTVRIWAIIGSSAANELDEQYKSELQQKQQHTDMNNNNNTTPSTPSTNSTYNNTTTDHHTYTQSLTAKVIYPIPYRIYLGHKADVVDIAWSKANFLLSASIDKTVRLWHISRAKCLCLFQHSDFVTAVAFHPIEDRYFLSASFDKKLRVWNIPEHRVVEWTQTSTIITSCTFSPNGQLTVAGLYNGQCVFYATDGLKYYTQVECRNRHGKYKKGKKVTGLQFTSDGKQLLVTTNDSRIRLYDMDDYRVVAKYKGTINDELQIRAYFDDTARYIICGSENECVYIWNTQNAQGKIDSYEYFKACQDTVTAARFLSRSSIRMYTQHNNNNEQKVQHCIIAAGYNGELKVFENTGVKKTI